MIDSDKFYLGRLYDPQQGTTTEQPFLYDPDDLTTHAVVVGMTGSGKTGLCLDILEEAALHNIPALMIDPKGDITNALLHFPDLLPSDFEPWINAREADRDGKTVAQAAADVAKLWRNGLAGWGIDRSRLLALQESAHFAVYTPGSDAGLPVSILASLEAPDLAWEDHEEVLRERISGTATALLGLVGLTNIDPVRSREHILLANIFEQAWSQGQNLTLAELIMQTQNPPFEKLGIFDVNTFFSEKDRFELALSLNSILAAPAFQTWLEGHPLDIPSLLYGPDGRPRHSIFYIAHLDDAERMFFVTLLYSAVETWMRTQSGTGSLRALLYFDEIFGYLPPTANPPSKEPMLRMLKQARAFGVGQILATQNPVDVDYKALSNAGTWFVGKLATDQDKQRLLDGLDSAMGGGLDRRQTDRLISSLGKRVFLARNVHEKQSSLFQTRWAMNYMAGPLTRTQLPALNALVGADQQVLTPAATTSAPRSAAASASASPAAALATSLGANTRASVPRTAGEYFLPNNLTLSEAARRGDRQLPSSDVQVGLLYRPVLVAQVDIVVSNRKYDVDQQLRRTALVPEPDRRGNIRWDNFEHQPIDARDLDRRPLPDGRFAPLEGPLAESTMYTAFKRDFVDWAYRRTEIVVRANEKLGVYAGPDVPEAEFRLMCREAARKKELEAIKKIEDRYERQIEAIEKKLVREERELEEDRDEYNQRKMEEGVSHLETVVGLFSRRRRSLSGSLSKRRMTSRAKADVEESEEAIDEFKEDLEELAAELEEELIDIARHWGEIAQDTGEITLQPYKKDVQLDLFGVAWLPHYVLQGDDKIEELPGFIFAD